MLCNAFSRPCEISRSPIDSSSDWPQVCTILIIIIANNAIIGAEEREAREAPPHTSTSSYYAMYLVWSQMASKLGAGVATTTRNKNYGK